MRLGGQFEIRRSMSEVYEFLVDPHNIITCLPDLQRCDVQDQEHFTATIQVGLGRLQGPVTMTVDFVEKRAASYARVLARGVMIGSKVNVESSFSLEDAGSGVTRIRWAGDAKIGGRLMYMADGILEPLINEAAVKFLRRMEAELELDRMPRQTFTGPG